MEGEQSDEFQLVPKSELEALRKEVEDIKNNPIKDYQSSLTLIEAMDKLADQLTALLQLFERANKEMYSDYQKGLHEDSEKLDKVISQNEKIAKGILAIVDKKHHNPSSSQEDQDQSPQQGQYPLKQSDDLPEAPWKREHNSVSRRSLVREFR
jgi:DNA-directed RNA polymerase beta' subunit